MAEGGGSAHGSVSKAISMQVQVPDRRLDCGVPATSAPTKNGFTNTRRTDQPESLPSTVPAVTLTNQTSTFKEGYNAHKNERIATKIPGS